MVTSKIVSKINPPFSNCFIRSFLNSSPLTSTGEGDEEFYCCIFKEQGPALYTLALTEENEILM